MLLGGQKSLVCTIVAKYGQKSLKCTRFSAKKHKSEPKQEKCTIICQYM